MSDLPNEVLNRIISYSDPDTKRTFYQLLQCKPLKIDLRPFEKLQEKIPKIICDEDLMDPTLEVWLGKNTLLTRTQDDEGYLYTFEKYDENGEFYGHHDLQVQDIYFENYDDFSIYTHRWSDIPFEKYQDYLASMYCCVENPYFPDI